MYVFKYIIIIITIIISVHISISFSLLRNCVSQSDWKKDQTTPKCEIITNSLDEKCYETNEISIPRKLKGDKTEDNIKLICKAKYPIDVDVNAVKPKGFPGIFSVRHVQNISDLNTYEYTIIVPFYAATLWSPRWYTIKSIKNPNINTTFYIYRPGPNDAVLPTDWGAEKLVPIIVKPNSRFAILPCVVSHYTDVVNLTKLGNKDFKYHDIEINNLTVKFESKIGFILDTFIFESPWGIYKCKALNPRTGQIEYLEVTLLNPDDFIPTPDQSILQMFDGSNLKLICQSRQFVQMNGVFNGIDIPQSNITYTQNDNLILKYKAIFQVSVLQVSDSGILHCSQNSDNGGDQMNLFKWEFNTFDLEKNDILQFNGDKTMEVSCQSKFSKLNLFSAECFNFAQCKTRLEFYNTLTKRQCDLPLLNIVNCGEPCGENNKVCFSTKQIRGNGIFKCEGPNLSKLMNFIKGWSGKLYTNIDTKLNDIPPEELVRISNNNTLYNGGLHTFECEASSFLSNGEYQWFFQTYNGSLLKPTIEATRGHHDFKTFNNSIWEVDIRLDNPNISKIICLAPKWNSEQWVNVSKIIHTKDPVKPYILDVGTQVTFIIGEQGRNLICSGIGEPRPNLVWEINGKNVTKPFETYEANDCDLILEFPIITENLTHIVFKCIATNFVGNFEQIFNVEIGHSPPNITPYIILGIILLLLLMITLIILYWKLLKAKSAIRNLSDEEVHEFLNGNPEAAKTVTEPTELILLLPYNPDYEIPRERIQFDEKDILGSGAYGIVFRGILLGYNGAVAIKTVKPYSAVNYFKALLSELKIMIYIGTHQNIVQLIGAYTGNIKERILYMVVELSPYGNLENYLRNNQRQFQNEIRDDRICFTKNMMQALYTNTMSQPGETGYINTLSTTELVNWAFQIAEGMTHLASKKVIHADLATRNVLLYDNGVVKITDFGLSRQLYAYTTYMKKEQEPLPWRSMAIESLREMNFSTQSDIWAYGVTLWEIFSLGAVPYPGLSWSIDFVDKLTQGLRLTKPQHATSEIYNIMLKCWNFEPDDRPSFIVIRNKFKMINDGVKKLNGK